ncbi:hypothetical protein Tco_0005348 [Tanacetum coccineum]
MNSGHNHADRPSLSNILHTFVMIYSNTIIRQDGNVQSFCGLKLSDMRHSKHRVRNIIDAIKRGYRAKKKSNSRYSQSSRSLSIPKNNSYCSYEPIHVHYLMLTTGTEVSYHNLGASSYEYRGCNATMCGWKNSREPDPNVGLEQFHCQGILNEVAALITNDFGDGEPTRDIVVNKKDGGPKRILELHPSYIALQYPLLFPYGEDGKEQGTTLLRGGRLFQQYLVDTYTTIEEQRLSWTRNNQDTLRVDLYHNVCDAVTRGDTNASDIGKRIVLNHTFTCGLRYTMQNYQYAMDLCCAYGNPDLFITFTSNLKWPEINEMLACVPGQRAHDRPRVGTRVFKLKLTELLPHKEPGFWGVPHSIRVNEYYANEEIDTRKQDFNKWVLAVGDGKLPAKIKNGEDEPSWIKILEKFLIKSSNSPIEQIVAETYPNFIERQRDYAYLRERAILTPRNDDADAINAIMFDKLEGESVTYNSADEICKAD